MRKFSILVLPLLLLLLLSSSSIAALSNGDWQANGADPPPDQFTLGSWDEIFWGGSAGQLGNELRAGFSEEWELSGSLLTSISGGGGSYTTTYTGGVLELFDIGPWWSGVVGPGSSETVSIISFTNTSTSSGGMLEFDIEGTGTVDSSGQSVILAATFNGIPTSKVFGGVNPNTGGIENDISGHGSQLGSASITITPIPGAVWLLATGLIGLVGIRRKMRQ